MGSVWNKDVDEIFNTGIKLSHLGLSNWALKRDQALNAIEELKALGIPILGGDVYHDINGIIIPNYDNWYCEQKPDESIVDFVTRSLNKAKMYIESYPIQKGIKFFFVLVPNV